MEFTYCSSIYSSLDLVKNSIEEILGELSKTISDSNDLFDIKLILTELIINGVFHGNKCNLKKMVNVDIRIMNDRIRIKVTDEGEGTDYNISSYDPLKMKCSGRGLVIVDGLSDELIFKDNSITAIKSI